MISSAILPSYRIVKTSLRFSLLFAFLLQESILSQKINRDLDNYLLAYFTNKNIPSVSAGVAQNGKIVWLGARGFADLENLTPATPQTVYRVASISKSITAVAIMQLVEEGKVKLDADVRTYIPYFPAKRWKFTTRQLLTHTSGIRDYRSGEFDNKNFFKNTNEIVEYLAKDSLVYEPGTKYLYSTLAYNLLAAIIENVSGMSFSNYLEKRIFEPAGMTFSSLDFQQEIIPNRARGYVKSYDRKVKNAPLADLSIKYAGGGLLSTSEDLLKFAIGIMDGKLISPATLDSMLVPVKLKNGSTRNYGLGFNPGIDSTGRKFFQHSGGGTGFSSLLIIYPAEKTAAVHLVNIRDRNVEDAAAALALIAMKHNVTLPKRSLADYLVNIYLNAGVDSAIAEYRKMDSVTAADFLTGENELLLFGYDLISMQKNVDAIKFFRYLISEFPQSSKAYIGLADAYQKDGNIGLSINSYRKALRIDPLNAYAERMIRKLNGK